MLKTQSDETEGTASDVPKRRTSKRSVIEQTIHVIQAKSVARKIGSMAHVNESKLDKSTKSLSKSQKSKKQSKITSKTTSKSVIVNEDLQVSKQPFYHPVELTTTDDHLIEFQDDDTVTSEDPFGVNAQYNRRAKEIQSKLNLEAKIHYLRQQKM